MTRQNHPAHPGMLLGAALDQISEELRALARVQEALHELYGTVLGQDVNLRVVLRQIVTTAMDLVGARYGALGVLSEEGDQLVEFVPVGLSRAQMAAAERLGSPRGRGLLGHLMADPRPMRIDCVSEHPMAVGLPPGHPRLHTLLGVAISSRGHIYGNLYLSDRRDGRPFDESDETMIVALAGAAGLAVDAARLVDQVRGETEEFQRLLLPQLPDLRPIEAATLYHPAITPGRIGGDWYDAIRLSDGTCAVVIGDIGGHGPRAAAAMAQARSMLRALLYEWHAPPGAVLSRLDRTLQAITDTPLTTACVAYLRPGDGEWWLHWSTAGHPTPLVIAPGEPGRYLGGEPGLPIGVEPSIARPDHHHRLPCGATLVFFTDGLVEHHDHSIDQGLAALARLATRHAHRSPELLCRALVDHRPGDGRDDIAILALRLPA